MAPTMRNYKFKDVDMLVSSSTVLESAIYNKSFLQTKRSTWADPYFDDLKAKIEKATQDYLGVDSAKDLRQATQAIGDIEKQTIKNLAELKVQITEDFKSTKIRRDEILNQLGFTTYHKAAQRGDQEGLINLLYQFKSNLSKSLKDEIIAKGTAPSMLDTIIGYADTLKNANIGQESFKGLKKTITAAAIKEFNEIYDQIISISKIAAKFYLDQPEVKDQFSFSKVAKALNAAKTKKTPTP